MSRRKNPEEERFLRELIGNDPVARARLDEVEREDEERAWRRKGINTEALRANTHTAVAVPTTAGLAEDLSMTHASAPHSALAASYQVDDPAASGLDLRREMPGIMMLKITQIEPYDHNPRLFKNERIEEIRASLVAHGFQGTMVVTRRTPGTDTYMLAAGSNTTLMVLKELYQTTGLPQFLYVNCLYQPFRSEPALLSQHLAENLSRGDMKFWEVALAMVELLRLIDEERRRADPRAKELSSRDAAEALMVKGLKVEKTLIQVWRFSALRLKPLRTATASLGAREAITFRSRANPLEELAAKFKITSEDFWTGIANPCLSAFADEYDAAEGAKPEFDAGAMADRIARALAERVGETPESLRQMLVVLKLNPAASLAQLSMPSPNLIAQPLAPTEDDEDRPLERSAAASGGLGAQQASQAPPELARQVPLALPPGVVRSTAAPASRSIPSPGRTSSSPTAATAPAQAPSALRRQEASVAQGSSIGSLFDLPQDPEGDPLQALHDALRRITEQAQLSDTLRWWDTMPLGFYLELPDRTAHQRRTVTIGSEGEQARQVKTVVWYALTQMSGQWFDGAVKYIDRDSGFFRHFDREDPESPMEGTDIEPHEPQPLDYLLARLSPGVMRPVMQQLRVVEELASRVFAEQPQRWTVMHELLKEASNPSY